MGSVTARAGSLPTLPIKHSLSLSTPPSTITSNLPPNPASRLSGSYVPRLHRHNLPIDPQYTADSPTLHPDLPATAASKSAYTGSSSGLNQPYSDVVGESELLDWTEQHTHPASSTQKIFIESTKKPDEASGSTTEILHAQILPKTTSRSTFGTLVTNSPSFLDATDTAETSNDQPTDSVEPRSSKTSSTTPVTGLKRPADLEDQSTSFLEAHGVESRDDLPSGVKHSPTALQGNLTAGQAPSPMFSYARQANQSARPPRPSPINTSFLSRTSSSFVPAPPTPPSSSDIQNISTTIMKRESSSESVVNKTRRLDAPSGSGNASSSGFFVTFGVPQTFHLLCEGPVRKKMEMLIPVSG